MITYVGVLQAAGTIEYVSGGITAIGSALVAALLLCYLSGVLSAFASSVGILGVAIPLAVPFLQQGEVSAVGMVAALAVATTIVDVSPFSTNGALILANAPSDIDRDRFYRQMLVYSGIVVAVGPLLAWLLLRGARLAVGRGCSRVALLQLNVSSATLLQRGQEKSSASTVAADSACPGRRAPLTATTEVPSVATAIPCRGVGSGASARHAPVPRS